MADAQLRGMVFEIQRASMHDGPGIRTTVFLKGCPLRCLWCHNPESVSALPQVAMDPCYPGGQKLFGRSMTVDEVMEEVLKDREFFKFSGGGLTISGGEPLAQAAFTCALARAAKLAGLHVCLQTSGYGERRHFKELMPIVDLFHFDYKATGGLDHVHLCGAHPSLILINLRSLLSEGAALVLRCPLIPGYNDSDEHLEAIATLESLHPELRGIDLLPYHNTGNDKARKLGLRVAIPSLESASHAQKSEWRSKLRSKGAIRADFLD